MKVYEIIFPIIDIEYIDSFITSLTRQGYNVNLFQDEEDNYYISTLVPEESIIDISKSNNAEDLENDIKAH